MSYLLVLILLLLLHFSAALYSSASTWTDSTATQHSGPGELYTSQAELGSSLINIARLVRQEFEAYLAKERGRLDELSQRLAVFREFEFEQSNEELVSNPLNAFRLLKALSVDFQELIDLVLSHSDSQLQTNQNQNQLINAISGLKKDWTFPTVEDLSGAASALARLQDTYLLDVRAMAGGDLGGGHCCAPKYTAEDCFEVGRQLHNSGDHHHAILWFAEAEALTRMLHDAQDQDQDEHIDIDIDIDGVLSESPNLEMEFKARILKYHSLSKLALSQKQKQKFRDDEVDVDADLQKAKYESLCRGEGQLAENDAQCHCQYVSKGNAYLLLGPLKEELVNASPPIYLYHDMMFESEIEIIKSLAQPKFERAKVSEEDTGQTGARNYRIGKLAWLPSNEHKYIESVEKRIGMATGLSLHTAEELQVGNYGLGGHYEPHYDFAWGAGLEGFNAFGVGNRLATFMIYMSHVEAGGATVFPLLGKTIWPRKGSAVFWYNLLENGSGDYSTLHAGCPVLIGSKWVANKWIHEAGQEQDARVKRPLTNYKMK